MTAGGLPPRTTSHPEGRGLPAVVADLIIHVKIRRYQVFLP